MSYGGLKIRIHRTPDDGVFLRMRRYWPAEVNKAGQAVGLALERFGKQVIAERFKTHQAGGMGSDWRKTDVVVSGSKFVVSAGSRKPYAKIQHYGGTILPRTVSRLAIPLLDELRINGMWPRDFEKGLFWSTSPTGPAVLINRRTGEAWYALVMSTEIPATHYLTEIAKRTAPYFRSRIAYAIRQAKQAARAEGGAS
jgi:hypothetical protein